MYFIHPEILWWLFLVLVPLIVHLFNFRRYKKLPFSNVEFLKNITRQTRKQNKVKHLIILLLRMLAVALVVLAFAGLRMGDKNRVVASSKVKSIYIDNSFSMMGETEKGVAFEVARNLAGELIKSSGRDEQFLIQTNDYSSGKKLLSKDEAGNELGRIKISPAVRRMSEVDNRQQMLLKRTRGFESYWFSDFQKYAADVESFIPDSIDKYYFMPVKLIREKNIFIDTCYFEKPVMLPGQKEVLKVVVTNASGLEYEKVPLKLFLNGQLKTVEGVDLKPYKNKEVTFTFTSGDAGWQYGLLKVEDYPVTFDDELYFSFRVNDKLKIFDIYSAKPNKFLKTFFETDSSFVFEEQNVLRLDMSLLTSANVVILDGLKEISSGMTSILKNYIEQGGSVLFVPSEEMNLASVNLFMQDLGAGSFSEADTVKTRVASLKKESPFFSETVSKVPENASLPSVGFHYPYHYSIRSGVESLSAMINGDDFFVMKKAGKGRLFVLTAPLDKAATDLMYNPLFVTILYGVSVFSDETGKLFYIIGRDEKIRLNVSLNKKDAIFTLKLKDSDYSFIPGQQQTGNGMFIMPYDEISRAGFYEGVYDDSVCFVLSFNYDHRESEMDFLNEKEMDSLLKRSGVRNYRIYSGEINNIRKVINLERKGSELWKLFIILALSMLLAEVLLLRFWK